MEPWPCWAHLSPSDWSWNNRHAVYVYMYIHVANWPCESFAGPNSTCLPIFVYAIAGVCTSVIFFILGVLATLAIQRCQKRRRIPADSIHKRDGEHKEDSEPVYAYVLPSTHNRGKTSPQQDLEMNSNAAYGHVHNTFNVYTEWTPVSYTHLTLPTIYSV